MAVRITLKASEVAAIIGSNPYKPSREVFDELWKKHRPETFTGQTRSDRAALAMQGSATAQAALVEAESGPGSAEERAAIAVSRICSDPALSEADREAAISHVRSTVYTTFGTQNEGRTAAAIEAAGATLALDDKFYDMVVHEAGGCRYVVVGRVDRIETTPDGPRLVEIKNRVNRLFHRVVNYENIQVQVYLQMLGLTKARLVEQYNSQIESHEIERDDALWVDEIMPKLQSFCAELDLVLCTTE